MTGDTFTVQSKDDNGGDVVFCVFFNVAEDDCFIALGGGRVTEKVAITNATRFASEAHDYGNYNQGSEGAAPLNPFHCGGCSCVFAGSMHKSRSLVGRT